MPKIRSRFYDSLRVAEQMFGLGKLFQKALPGADEALRLGMAAIARNNYSEAAKWLRLAADQGQKIAQYSLGVLYKQGQGVQRNDYEAIKWWTKAAEQGFIPAQFNVGLMYEQGDGVQQNYTEAAKWYRIAAEQGDEKVS